MPLICSEELRPRKEAELDELLAWEEFEDPDDFFVVFCVAVRLHSKDGKR